MGRGTIGEQILSPKTMSAWHWRLFCHLCQSVRSITSATLALFRFAL